MDTNSFSPYVTDIRDWKRQKGDTLTKSTFEHFLKSWDEDHKDVYKNSQTATYFYFMGDEEEYDPESEEIKANPKYHKYHYLCHAYWTSGHNQKGTDGFMNIFPNNLRPESNARFYNFLFDPVESPFREALKTCTIIRDPKKNLFPQGLLWTNVEGCDIRLFTSLLIATRLCSGWALDNVWGRLVDLGFEPREALVLTPLFSWAGQSLTVSTDPISKYGEKAWETTTLTHTGPWSSDQPFGFKYNTTNRWDKFSPKRVIEINPIYHEGLKTSSMASPNPSNYIWNTDKEIFKGPLNGNSILYKGLLANKLDPDVVKEIQAKLRSDTPINWSKEY